MRIGIPVVSGLLVLAYPGAPSAVGAQPTPAITILVYNNAPVPDDLLRAAEGEADRIFARAGVGVNWFDCSMEHPGVGSQGPCHDGWGTINMGLRVVVNPPPPTDPRTHLVDPRRPERLGFAVRPGLASVYYDPRWRFAGDERALHLPMILGVVIAHEVGHLLLGPDRHSRQGLMRPEWDSRQFHQATLRELFFSEEESADIRAEARRRMHALAATRP